MQRLLHQPGRFAKALAAVTLVALFAAILCAATMPIGDSPNPMQACTHCPPSHSNHDSPTCCTAGHHTTALLSAAFELPPLATAQFIPPAVTHVSFSTVTAHTSASPPPLPQTVSFRV